VTSLYILVFRMKLLARNIILIASLFFIINLSISFTIRYYLHDHLHERKSLFYELDLSQYELVITGDSVFGSNYVTSRENTLWAELEKISGKEVFPGAIDGSKALDLISTAEYLSEKLKPGTIVFMDSTPSRNWGDIIKANYHNQFFMLRGYTDYDKNLFHDLYNKLMVPITSRMFRGRDLFEVFGSIAGRSYYKKNVKNWRESVDQTRENLKLFEEYETKSENKNIKIPSYVALKIISDIYKNKKIRLIVVLSPLNKDMAKLIGSDLKKYKITHDSLIRYLQLNEIEYIDMFNKLNQDMFVDMIHTNGNGDYYMARIMNNYINKI